METKEKQVVLKLSAEAGDHLRCLFMSGESPMAEHCPYCRKIAAALDQQGGDAVETEPSPRTSCADPQAVMTERRAGESGSPLMASTVKVPEFEELFEVARGLAERVNQELGDYPAYSVAEDTIQSAEALLPKIPAQRDKEWQERLLGKEAQSVVIDFFSSWRFCPVAQSPTPSRSCLEDAASQLLAALDHALPDGEGGR